MKIRNESLCVAMKAYVSSALEFVAARAKNEQGSSGGGDFDFYWVVARYSNDLCEISQYESCLRELVGDQKINRHLNQNVSSYSRGGLSPSAEGMMRQVLDLGKRLGSYDFDPERFEREYLSFEETFYSEVLMIEAIAPLQGLLLNIPVVRLSADIEISRLEEDEMKPYRTNGSQWNGRWCAVRLKYQLPKVIGPQKGEDRYSEIEEERAIEERANDKIEEVVNALRLLGKGDVFHSGIIHRTSEWLPVQHRTVANRMLGAGFANWEFGDQDALLLNSLWRNLELPKVRKELDVAVRRFGDSCVRHRNEDKLIDLMIAAEAIFLRGTKEGEKSFRLALRAGQFLGKGSSAKEVRDQMALAYHCRSVLVHGGKPSSDRKLKKLNLQEFTDTISRRIQTAILSAIDLLASPETVDQLDDKYWDRYLFGSQGDSNVMT